MSSDVRIGVTGSRGLIGATVMQMSGGVALVPLQSDITNVDAIEREVADSALTHIIHCAAMTSVAECERRPADARTVNVEGTENVIKAAQAVGAAIVHVSTVSVFSGKTGNYKESDVPDPIANVYNETKREAETRVADYAEGRIVRLNVMGIHPGGSRGKNFMEWLVDSFRTNRDMTLFSDVRVNALSSDSVAQYLLDIALRARPGVYHIATRDVCSKAEIGRLAAPYFPQYRGTISEASVDSVADGIVRPKEMWLNCDKTTEVLHFRFPLIREEVDRIFSRA